jgi:hypothetical protein
MKGYAVMQIPASTLVQSRDYPNFPEFARFGIDLSKVDAELILELQQLRRTCSKPLTPSPDPGAWYRTSGSTTSQHYAVNRLSTAGDFFPNRGDAFHVWLTALSLPKIKGLGIYANVNGLDGTRQLMLHIDIRKSIDTIMWLVTAQNKYISYQQDSVAFRLALLDIFRSEI